MGLEASAGTKDVWSAMSVNFLTADRWECFALFLQISGYILYQTSNETLKNVHVVLFINYDCKEKILTIVNSYNTLTENKFVEWSKLKEAAEGELNMSQKWDFYHKQNNLEKEERLVTRIFFFFLIV